VRGALLKLLSHVRNATMDLRYGGLLHGMTAPRFPDAYPSVSSSYDVLPILFAGVVVTDKDVLVDVGCGKGRVINWWLHRYGRNRIYGIEIDPEIAAAAAKRLKRYKNVQILTGDACELLPEDATIFMLFNPFNERATFRFMGAVKALPDLDGDRKRTILYYNCLYKDLFVNDGGFAVRDLVVPKGCLPCAVIVSR